MKAFIDTSTLVKKYFLEEGSDKFDEFLNDVTIIVVAPVYLMEIRGMARRKLMEKLITIHQADRIREDINQDYEKFEKILWDEPLEQAALTIIEKYPIKTLDSIQLASALLSKADSFVTSNHKLFQIAKKELKNVVCI